MQSKIGKGPTKDTVIQAKRGQNLLKKNKQKVKWSLKTNRA
jgi:hypothetical protein